MDEADYGNERMEKWLEAQISEHQYQLAQAGNDWPYGPGRCKNCSTELDDGRPYCDKSCADDYADRLRAERRNGKYRGE